MADPPLANLCPNCGEYETGSGDFVCPFCFRRLPDAMKRKLRFARGRPEESKKKDEALHWLSKRRNR